MKKILIIGAGRSASSLIDYILKNSISENWQLIVADISLELAQAKVKNHSRGIALEFDIFNNDQREKEIQEADIIISMLPAHMHISVAKDCIRFKKNMVTASYVSEEMKALDSAANQAGVLLLNEIGVDPGIDHMSAMKIVDEIRDKGGKVISFESFTGGLLAPEAEKENPWKYKFSWNPRNVVLAGQGVVKFIQENKYKYIPYTKIFRRTEIVEIEGYGKFEGYANRDSLKYREVYGLEDVKTIYRGTFRRPGFCRAWDIFVQLGATDDSYTIGNSEHMTYREFINSFLAFHESDSVELKLMHYMKLDQDDVEVLNKLEWLDIYKDIKIGLKNATPAQILQQILERKWTLQPEDKDMIVMWHKFIYELNGQDKFVESSMVVTGEDKVNTAMSKTVGLPIAIATKMILNGTIKLTGVQIPVTKQIYLPVLKELEEYGVNFNEKYF
ncbi:MAG: saccharopine dehydrogenase NADP-binding domain-containing protein [Bacteroidetes bacterium]|nr:saccharopine dehydrogenase NADP-binding domain-containing protein [Bacteroidota bacterium]HET6244905.1 saccharopine dehydrogenase C-terminal domain-containing protein [Bacteroidia bacterium]